MDDDALPVPNSLQDFEARFDALCDQAKAHGIVSVYGIYEDDFLAGTTRQRGRWTGGVIVGLGLLDYLRAEMRARLLD